jgi:quercetin dioxygenase-like cupin family protein
MKYENGNWFEAEWEPVREGISRVVFGISADGTTLSVADVRSGHETKPHSHPAQQVVVITQGTCVFHVGGEVYPVKKGSWIVIPSNVEHYIEVTDSEEPVINLDIFVPARPDYAKAYTDFLESKHQK